MINSRDVEIILSSSIDWDSFRGKTVLVTGATGRLGMYIVAALCAANVRWSLDVTIVALARDQRKARELLGEFLDFSFVELALQDITDPICLNRSVHYIFHIAGLASPSDFTYRPVDTLLSHVKGTNNVLELARKVGTEKVFYASTVEVYGKWNTDRPIKESDMGPLDHSDVRACYPEAKRLCETMLATYKAQYGVDYVGVRMSHTFGPGISLDDGRAFAEFIRNVVDGEDIVLHSDGSAIRTYTYVADAVAAMFLAFTKGEKEFYNVANTDNQISIRDLAQLIADLDPTGRVSVRFSDGSSHLAYLPFRLGIMDSTEICLLGWKPQVGLHDAFKWTMESFLQK